MSDSFISWRESPCRKKKQSGCNRLVRKTARMRPGRVTASGGNQLRGLSKLRKMRRFELDPNRPRGPCLPCGIPKIFTAFRAHQRCPSLTKLAKQRARKVGEVGGSEVRLNHLLHSPSRTERHHVHQTADRQNVKMRISPTPANNLGFDKLSLFFFFKYLLPATLIEPFSLLSHVTPDSLLLFLTCCYPTQRAPCV